MAVSKSLIDIIFRCGDASRCAFYSDCLSRTVGNFQIGNLRMMKVCDATAIKDAEFAPDCVSRIDKHLMLCFQH